MRKLIVACLLMGACGAGPVGEGEFVAATIDGLSWRAKGQATQHAMVNPAGGSTHFFGIRGYTPIMPTDGSFTNGPAPGEPRLDILFTDLSPAPGTYDITTTPAMTVTYGPDENRTFAAQTGTVVISRIEQDGVEGSFSFTGVLMPSGPDTVAVTQGSFSTPILIVP